MMLSLFETIPLQTVDLQPQFAGNRDVNDDIDQAELQYQSNLRWWQKLGVQPTYILETGEIAWAASMSVRSAVYADMLASPAADMVIEAALNKREPEDTEADMGVSRKIFKLQAGDIGTFIPSQRSG
jgi:hypothetical protein